MSPRGEGPAVFVTVDQAHGIALVRGPRAAEILDAAGIEHRRSRSRTKRGWVIEARMVADIRSYCQWRGLLAIVSGEPKPPRVRVEPVFVAPEPKPEPEPDPHVQDGLFGG